MQQQYLSLFLWKRAKKMQLFSTLFSKTQARPSLKTGYKKVKKATLTGAVVTLSLSLLFCECVWRYTKPQPPTQTKHKSFQYKTQIKEGIENRREGKNYDKNLGIWIRNKNNIEKNNLYKKEKNAN